MKASVANRIRDPSSRIAVNDGFQWFEIGIIRLTLKNPTWKLKPQGWNSKELAGAYKDAGLCGLIRYYAKNLTSFCIIRVSFEKTKQFNINKYIQVLHGCRQLVP